jgi:hypothetical protein
MVIAILGFAIVFPVVATFAGTSGATVTAILAALPGLIVAVRSGR